MSNAPKSVSEKRFQENFTEELQKYKWKSPDFLDGTKKKVTVNDLINHWRTELNRLNADQLEGVELTDNEFNQVMAKVNRINNSYEAAKLLAMEQGKGKIDGIYRDDNEHITNKQLTLTIFKKAAVSGGDSNYQIAREVETPNNNRFDIVLLINGLPLINIEQKRTDKTLDEAFGQFKRYYRDGEYCNNFMAFSQMMVMNTEIETKYFATPKSIEAFNPSFVFHWSDKENKRINNWRDVIANFLMIPMAHQMVGDYLVIDASKDEEKKRHMLLRPYQVYALQAIEGAAIGWDNADGIPHGGFVWHTTGSGKTITSFKTALFLSTRAGFDKVVFLVDRLSLDKATSENFEAYSKYESVTVDKTKYTSQLRNHFKSKGIVVTTTYKLHNLVKELIEKQDESLSTKRIVFIVDEAHRTTMGNMMGIIKDYFRNNGLFYGFTGTPLFDENNVKGKVNKKSEVINTTEKLFGPKLHSYTIDEAIRDKNVLGFHVDYINTGEFLNYEDLREQLIEKMKHENPEKSAREIERLYQEMNNLEIEIMAVKNNLFEYQDETHIPRVVTEILENWSTQSQHKKFNAILTVRKKERVIAYYHEFKKQLEQRNETLNIAMTVSFGGENEDTPLNPTMIKEMFEDYADFTGIEFIVGDKKRGEDAYSDDIVDRGERGGQGRNPKNIDLIIVAEQLLTGYDSDYLNTIYVDRTLELQSLIQAYSRTNRIYGAEKEFGTIVNFQYPEITKEEVQIALKLYGSGGSSSRAIVEDYKTAVMKLGIELENLIETLPDPTAWATIIDDEERKNAFIKAFKDASGQLNLVEQYYQYEWNDETFGMSEHTWFQYIGAYRNLVRKDDSGEGDDTFIIPLSGTTKLVGSQRIDAHHILSLIGDKVTTENGIQTVDDETIRIVYEQIQELSNLGEDEQAQLLKEFVDEEVINGNLSSTTNFDEAFDLWKSGRLLTEIQNFAKIWGIDPIILQKSVKSYDMRNEKVIPYLSEMSDNLDFTTAINKLQGNLIIHKRTLSEEIKTWMLSVKQRLG